MPLELQIIRFGEFVQLGADGHFDLNSSREVLKQLAGACRRRGVHQALLDLREVHPGPTPMLTPEDLAALVNSFHEMGFSEQQRLAVLYSADPHHGARLFAMISKLRGWNVKATDSFEDALNWLAQGPSEPDKKDADAQEIPLHFTKPAEDVPLRIHPAGETGGSEIK